MKIISDSLSGRELLPPQNFITGQSFSSHRSCSVSKFTGSKYHVKNIAQLKKLKSVCGVKLKVGTSCSPQKRRRRSEKVYSHKAEKRPPCGWAVSAKAMKKCTAPCGIQMVEAVKAACPRKSSKRLGQKKFRIVPSGWARIGREKWC